MKYKSISNEPFIRHRITFPYCYQDDVFNEEELTLIENYCDKFEKHDGIAGGDISSIRKSKVKFFTKHEHSELNFLFDKINSVIWNINEQYYNYDLNGYGSLQYTNYNGEELGKYGYHIDMHTGMYDNPDDDLLLYGDTRKLSVVLFVSDPSSYEGGEFKMMLAENSETEIEQKKGKIILFPSFFLHKVYPVTKGIRKSIVTWVEGPKFI
jgi:PKHD-type hydroxylase